MKIDKNSRVKINYEMTLPNGEVIERTEPGEPLVFTTGREEIIGCLEDNIIGMEPGEKREFEVQPDQAFGHRDPESVRVVDREELVGHGDDLSEGMIFRIRDEDGNSMVVTVASMDEDEVIFDLNHPLAGATLKFEVEILEVNPVGG